MVHITSRRHTQRQQASVEVKVYSNQDSASLRVNGVDFGTLHVTGHIATWRLQLTEGANRIEVTAGSATDSVEWHYQRASSPSQRSDTTL